ALYDDGSAPITQSSILVPFVASSFLGVFYEEAPPKLDPDESFEVTKYFVIGSGDAGSVLDVVHEIRRASGARFGRLGGLALDAVSGRGASDGARVPSAVLIYQRLRSGARRIFTQYDVRADGSFGGTLEPGAYSLRVVGE